MPPRPGQVSVDGHVRGSIGRRGVIGNSRRVCTRFGGEVPDRAVAGTVEPVGHHLPVVGGVVAQCPRIASGTVHVVAAKCGRRGTGGIEVDGIGHRLPRARVPSRPGQVATDGHVRNIIGRRGVVGDSRRVYARSGGEVPDRAVDGTVERVGRHLPVVVGLATQCPRIASGAGHIVADQCGRRGIGGV